MNECYIELKHQWNGLNNNENRKLLLSLHNQYDETKNAAKKIILRDKVFTFKQLPKTIKYLIFDYAFDDFENLQARGVSKNWKSMIDDFINHKVKNQIAPKIFLGFNYQKPKLPLRFLAILYALFKNKIIYDSTVEVIFKASNNVALTTICHRPKLKTINIWRAVILEDIISLVSLSGMIGLWLNPKQPNQLTTLLKNLNSNYKDRSDKVMVPKMFRQIEPPEYSSELIDLYKYEVLGPYSSLDFYFSKKKKTPSKCIIN